MLGNNIPLLCRFKKDKLCVSGFPANIKNVSKFRVYPD
jgi:hypothetical protein